MQSKGFKPKTYKEALEERLNKPKNTPKTKRKAKKVVKLTPLKKKLWGLVSPFIRNRDKFICITCGKTGSGGAIHAGHFIPSSVGGALLRFHPLNLHAQCFYCNINLGGNGAIYYVKMVQRYGQEKVDKLMELKNLSIQADEYFYQSMIDLYIQGNQQEIIKHIDIYP